MAVANIASTTNRSDGSASITTGDACACGNNADTTIHQDAAAAFGDDGLVIADQDADVDNEGEAEANTGDNEATGNDSDNDAETEQETEIDVDDLDADDVAVGQHRRHGERIRRVRQHRDR